MPLSSRLAPGFVRVTYSGVNLPHHQIIPINFDGTPTPGVRPDLVTKVGTPVSIETGVNAWLNEMAKAFNTDTTFGLVECYAVDPDTGVRTFIWAYNSIEAGSDAIAENVPQSEGVFTFKTIGGGKLNVYVMEGTYTPDSRNVGEMPAGSREDIADYVTGDTSIFFGRDNTYPFAVIAFTSKINDVLRRRQGFTEI